MSEMDNGSGTFEQVAAEYWGKVESRLPSHLTDKQKVWIRNYLQAQVALHLGDFVETRKILTRLDGDEGFLAFEERRPEYFATMDVIARGKTNRERTKILFRKEDF